MSRQVSEASPIDGGREDERGMRRSATRSPSVAAPHFPVCSLSCFYAIKLNITYITIKLPNINSGHDGTRGFALFTIAF